MTSNPARVLIVDDELGVREALELMVKALGYVAEACVSGREAIARLEADDAAFDLMILDLQMPDLDGIGTLSRLSAQGTPTPPVLICSGYPGARLEQARRARVVVGVIKKPFSLQRLKVAIEQALAAR